MGEDFWMKQSFLLKIILLFLLINILNTLSFAEDTSYGTAALMVIVERETGSIAVLDTSKHTLLGRVTGLGNLNHGTVKFSKDGRYAYVISKDAFVSKIDLLTLKVVKKIKGGNESIGGTISQDGKYLIMSNYSPGEVRILSSDTLETVKVISAIREYEGGRIQSSKVVGLVDAPGNLLIFSLMDSNGIWVIDAGKKDFPVINKFWDIGEKPFDGLITPDGRYYLAGFLESDWFGLLDTWEMKEVKKIPTKDINNASEKNTVPLWKIPHLKGWAIAAGLAVLPAVQREAVLIYDTKEWKLIKELPLIGTALYTVASPDNRYVWVDLVGRNGDVIQVIDLKSLEVIKTFSPGKGATHPQFTSKGDTVYISLMDEDKVVVYDPSTFEKVREFSLKSPSGIFSVDRIYKFGM